MFVGQLVRRHVAHILLPVLSEEDYVVASEMNHHYMTGEYGDDNDVHVPPGDEGFDFSHGGREFADIEDLRDGFKKLERYVFYSLHIIVSNCQP